jgi:SMI1/KNR4 family protein SUKH-1
MGTDGETVRRYRALCARIRTCWLAPGYTFDRPPASEEQVRATESALGYRLPSLLRLLYRTVANGGNGLLWYSEDFPVIGVAGGYTTPEGQTIGDLGVRSTWRLHSCIADALRRNPGRYVYGAELPNGWLPFTYIGTGHAALDTIGGAVYEVSTTEELTLADNQPVVLHRISHAHDSLEEWMREWAEFSCEHARVRCGYEVDAALEAYIPPGPDTQPTEPRAGYAWEELRPEAVDPHCREQGTDVWCGLYRGLDALFFPDEPEA